MKPEAGSARASHTGETVVPGTGSGALLVLDEPLSFWGGYDAQAGAIVEPRHPQYGMSLQGKTLLMARAKGSSSSSSVLAEAIRNGTGPAAIVMRERDLIVALGCIVASELYGIDVPIAVVDAATWKALAAMPAGTVLRVDAAAERCIIAAHP
jgi:predicted aconitase with swiveling domain